MEKAEFLSILRNKYIANITIEGRQTEYNATMMLQPPHKPLNESHQAFIERNIPKLLSTMN